MSRANASRAAAPVEGGAGGEVGDGDERLGFEDALGRLGKAVEALEAGDLGLDAALARYEEGVRLLVRCRSLIDGAERRVALLTGVDDDGTPRTEPFDAQATTTNRPTATHVPEPEITEDDAPF